MYDLFLSMAGDSPSLIVYLKIRSHLLLKGEVCVCSHFSIMLYSKVFLRSYGTKNCSDGKLTIHLFGTKISVIIKMPVLMPVPGGKRKK